MPGLVLRLLRMRHVFLSMSLSSQLFTPETESYQRKNMPKALLKGQSWKSTPHKVAPEGFIAATPPRACVRDRLICAPQLSPAENSWKPNRVCVLASWVKVPREITWLADPQSQGWGRVYKVEGSPQGSKIRLLLAALSFAIHVGPSPVQPPPLRPGRVNCVRSIPCKEITTWNPKIYLLVK